MAKPSKKSNGLTYKVVVYNDGVQRVDGDIISISDSVMLLRYQRPGSSAYSQRHISMSNVIGMSGGVGKASTVLFKDRIEAFTVKKGNVSPGKNGMLDITWVTPRGDTKSISIKAEYVHSEATQGVEKPGAELSGKKKKAGGGKKADKKKADKKDK